MGQIIIDIPNSINRRYVFLEPAAAASLIDDLDAVAVRVKGNPKKLSPTMIENLSDLIAASEAREDYRRRGIGYSVADLRKEFGLV